MTSRVIMLVGKPFRLDDELGRVSGVSPHTVSRVLNADAPVEQKNKYGVSKATVQMGYVLQPLRSNKSGLVDLSLALFQYHQSGPKAHISPETA